MPRLIDADKLIELCNIMADRCDGIGKSIWEQFATTVEWSPTVDAVEVVRCKDCKFYWKNNRDSDGVVCLATPKDDAFCSEGERKEDGQID